MCVCVDFDETLGFKPFGCVVIASRLDSWPPASRAGASLLLSPSPMPRELPRTSLANPWGYRANSPGPLAVIPGVDFEHIGSCSPYIPGWRPNSLGLLAVTPDLDFEHIGSCSP